MSSLRRCLAGLRSSWGMWVAPAVVVALTVPLVISLPLLQKQLVDDVLITRRIDLLPPTVGAYGAVWLLIALAQVGATVLRANLDERLGLHLRQRLFAQCESLSVDLWHREHSGRTLALFSNDVPQVAGFLGSTAVTAFGHVVMLVAGAVAMASLSWTLAVVVVCVPPLVAGLAALGTRPLRRVARRAQDVAASASEQLHEGLAGLREIAAFTPRGAHGERLSGVLRALMATRMRLAAVGAGIAAGQSVFSLAVTLSVLGAGGYMVIAGHVSLGTVIAMEGIYSQMYPTATALVGLVIGGQKVLASADRVAEFLARTPRVAERPGALPLQACRGHLAFEDVSFGYLPERRVLENVSFQARAGERIAIVGPSGAGKTTLVGLVARFYDPDAGRVLLDGRDVRDVTLDGLRRQIGIVFQDPFLFSTSIRENIALGWPEAPPADVEAAARAAQVWEFAGSLPEGLDTQVGQRAAQLSEGQKQRIAIARALLRDPRILILDEPTSALDARSELAVQRALETLMEGRTTLVVAHRLRTIQQADRILVLEQGRLVEQGTHAELAAHGGLYRELYDLQRWWK